MYLFAVIVVLSCVSVVFSLDLREKVYKLKSLTNCRDYPNAIVRFGELKISHPKKNMFTFSGGITINETVHGPLTLLIKIVRCRAKMCEPYDTLKIATLCDKLNDKNVPWYPFMRVIQPRIHCPLTKGNYTITHGSFDMSIASSLPVEAYSWKTQTEIWKGQNDKEIKLIFCGASEMTATVPRPIRTNRDNNN